MMLLSACGGTGAELAATATEDESYTVSHAMGEATLEEEPERIVVLDSPHLDALMALDIVPVGASEASAGSGFPEYLSDRLAGTEVAGLIAEPNLEAIASLRPDLIIGAKVRHEELYSTLSEIAPTVFSELTGTDWREQARITAAAVNKTSEMDELLAGFDERAAAVGDRIGASGMTASVVRFRPESFRLYGPESFSGSVLTQVGFDLGERDWGQYSIVELSPENFADINGDVIFYTNPGGDPAAGTYDVVASVWGAQPAVASGAVFEVAEPTWMLGIGVIGANLVLDDLEELLG